MAESKRSSRQIVLRKKADGFPTTDCFELKTVTLPELKDGEVLVAALYLSLDPYMRGRIGSDASKSSRQPNEIGSVLPGATVGEVLESKFEGLKAGDLVHHYSGWVSHYIADGKVVQKCDVDLGVPLVKHLGVLGMTGLTAYYGLNFVGEAKAGESVVVSGAAGAVGMVVAQVAKILGCHVVGLAGSAEKCKFLTHELKLDAAVNYKDKDWKEQLDKALPKGVDVYFDNTGGEITDNIIPRINKRARIVICGQISTYNAADGVQLMGPRLLHHLLWKTAKMQGFLVQDYNQHEEKARKDLAGWLTSGKLIAREDITDGLENAPTAFLKLFKGENNGKLAVKINEPSKALADRLKAATEKASKHARDLED